MNILASRCGANREMAQVSLALHLHSQFVHPSQDAGAGYAKLEVPQTSVVAKRSQIAHISIANDAFGHSKRCLKKIRCKLYADALPDVMVFRQGSMWTILDPACQLLTIHRELRPVLW
jgi:hypothetical protein